MIKNVQLSEEITNKLLVEIKSGMFANEKKLPSEVDVASRLGVSRTIIRESFARLEQSGYISRKHGVGTIINRHILEVDNRMELGKDFTQMIIDAGKEPKVLSVEISLLEADEEIAKNLKIEKDSSIFKVSRLIAADEVPVVYCIDYFSKALIVDNNYTSNDMKQSIYYFMEKFCKTQIYMGLTEISSIDADEELANLFNINKGQSIIYIDDIEYNFKGEVILYSQQYYANGVIKHTVLRKKV